MQDAAKGDSVAVSPEDEEFEPNDEQKKWMDEQLKKQAAAMKELYGDDFGSDLGETTDEE